MTFRFVPPKIYYETDTRVGSSANAASISLLVFRFTPVLVISGFINPCFLLGLCHLFSGVNTGKQDPYFILSYLILSYL